MTLWTPNITRGWVSKATLEWLYNNAGTQVDYSIKGVEVSALVSNIVKHSVSVNFETTYGNNDIYSSTITYKDRGNYYYFVPSSGIGSGSQTWTYWYATGTWKSDSTADANNGTFYIDWSAPFLIMFLGLPEVLFSGGWSVSNSMGWNNPGQSWIPVSTGVSGSDQVGGYSGTFL